MPVDLCTPSGNSSSSALLSSTIFLPLELIHHVFPNTAVSKFVLRAKEKYWLVTRTGKPGRGTIAPFCENYKKVKRYSQIIAKITTWVIFLSVTCALDLNGALNSNSVVSASFNSHTHTHPRSHLIYPWEERSVFLARRGQGEPVKVMLVKVG